MPPRMTADPDDLAARMTEAAARTWECHCHETAKCDICKGYARAALAAAVKESGLDAVALRQTAETLASAAATRRDYEAIGHGMRETIARTTSMERTALALRALAGIADAE